MSTTAKKGSKKGKKGVGASSVSATENVQPEKQGLYAERTIWSQRFKGWSRYYVKRPRLPHAQDKGRWVDSLKHRPGSFNGLTGKQNETVTRSLVNNRDNLESVKILPDSVIIYGSHGSGKTTLAQAYVNELVDVLDLAPSQASKWVLSINADTYKKDFGEMFKLIFKFFENPN